MELPPPTILAIAQACAPGVSALTLGALVQAESGRDPLAIGVNRPRAQHLHPKSPADAIGMAANLLAAGASIDVGLAQINSANLRRLGLNLSNAFDPCRNIGAAGKMLAANYRLAHPEIVGEQPALRIALSYYNTGRPDRGLRNGYVAEIDEAARGSSATRMVPALVSAAAPPPAAWDVFASTSISAGFVITPDQSGDDR